MTTLSSILPPVNVSQASGTLPVANGGTGATTLTGVIKGTGTSALTAGTVSLTTEVSGTLPVGSGGTGATTLTGVIKGTGTSALTAGTVSLTTEVSGTLPVGSGGTGATTLTGVIKGTGTSALTAGTVSLTTEVSGTLPVANGGTGAATLTANNVLLGNGTSALQAVAPGAAGNILTSNGTTWASTTPAPSGPTMTAIASGSLSDGSRVIINADGTVSVAGLVAAAIPSAGAEVTNPQPSPAGNIDSVSAVFDSASNRVVVVIARSPNGVWTGYAAVGTISGTTISFGSLVSFGSALYVSAAYDANTQRVVIAYANLQNSTFGTAVIGTVSNTSISFGSPVVFASQAMGANGPRIVYAPDTQKVIISYSAFGIGYRSVVGTVSGTSISFGTPVTFLSGARDDTLLGMSATYDTNSQRVVIFYANNQNSNFGTAIVGTVSGTSISFGTPVVFNSASTSRITSAYDASQAKVVLCYGGFGNVSAQVGTVSGTSISFGATTALAADINMVGAIVYDASVQRIVITATTNSSLVTARLATVSGTSISIGSPVTLMTSVIDTFGTAGFASAFSPNNSCTVSFYLGTSASIMNARVVSSGTTNLTSENFIGFSNAAYTNGQTATIQIVGSVDDAQSGLTPGRAYYVQTGGTLSTTPGTPSVFAGTAVAATKIIVKG